MKILSHRGYWQRPDEKNTRVAFERSFFLGYGTETDVRDHNGQLVIAHDLPTATAMPFQEFLDIYRANCDGSLPLAINIKADGLADLLQEAMAKAGLNAWFTFDMSVPDFMVQHRKGLPVYSRRSDVEVQPVLDGMARGAWVDSFAESRFPAQYVREALAQGKAVCLVSPELHGRGCLGYWTELRRLLRQIGPAAGQQLQLCTDTPERATSFFWEVL